MTLGFKAGRALDGDDVFRLRVDRRSFSLWTPSCDSTDGWLGSPEPEPVTMFPIEFNCCFS